MNFSKMYPKGIFYFSRYFDLLGFCTGLPTFSSRHFKYVHFIFIFHVIQASILTAAMVRYIREPNIGGFALFNDYIKIIVALIVYWFSIFELYLKRNTLLQFWDFCHLIIERHCDHRGFFLQSFVYRMTFSLMGVLFSYIAFFVRVVSQSPSNIFHQFWFAYGILTMMCINRLFCYIFYIEIIAHGLKMIDNEVKEMARAYGIRAKYSLRKEPLSLVIFQRTRFKWIREYYQLIQELNSCLNDAFTFSNFPTIFFTIQVLLCDTNWMIYFFCNSIPIYYTGPGGMLFKI